MLLRARHRARLLLSVCAILSLGLAGCRTLPQPHAPAQAEPPVSISLDEAIALDAEADYAGAERSAAEALALAERYARPDDPGLPALLLFLARQNANRAHFSDARRHLAWAQDLVQATQAADKVQLVLALTQLDADLAMLAGRPERGEAAVRALLARQEADLGPRHPLVAQSLILLARLAESEERLEPAAALWTEARAILRNAWGDRHPDFAWATVGLAYNRALAGQPEEAERLAREAGAITEALAREAPAEIRAEAAANHGRLLTVQAEMDLLAERFESARDRLDQALPLLQDNLADGHPDAAWARVLLGEALSQLGAFDLAESHLSEGVDAIRRAHSDQHPVYMGALLHRSVAYDAAGWNAEAVADLEEAMLIRERTREAGEAL